MYLSYYGEEDRRRRHPRQKNDKPTRSSMSRQLRSEYLSPLARKSFKNSGEACTVKIMISKNNSWYTKMGANNPFQMSLQRHLKQSAATLTTSHAGGRPCSKITPPSAPQHKKENAPISQISQGFYSRLNRGYERFIYLKEHDRKCQVILCSARLSEL